MRHNMIETVMGAVVLVIAGFFLVFAYRSAELAPIVGYNLSAKFERIDGLNIGSDVRLSGVKIGVVTDLVLDPVTFLAVTSFDIDSTLQLPVDTSAEVVSESFLGGKYIALIPGGSDDVIRPGGEIKYTQSSVSIESMIGKLIFSDTSKGKNSK